METLAITRYRNGKAIRQEPVDDFDDIQPEFLKDIDTLFDYVEWKSREYCDLEQELHVKAKSKGFRYLNSPEFEALSRKKHEALENTVAESGDDNLKRILAVWNEALRRRRDSMVKRIHDFCRINQFTQGLFLVGAEHRVAILEELEQRKLTAGDIVLWKIDDDSLFDPVLIV